jgi:methyltransferase OMS1
MAARLPRLVGGAAVYGVGVFATYEYMRPVPQLPTAKERCCKFGCLAPNYDAEVDKDEASSGIVDLRRELVAKARGRVLEVAGGTGRNLAYYDPEAVDDLTITDNSEPMLHVAAHKVAALRRESTGGERRAPPSKVTLAVTDACALALPEKQYDTVVDTFGLCSFERPEEALREMCRCCKPGGQILLLEHGESDWGLLARWQQHRLNRHVANWGCFWNRDILRLVREERGLRVKEVTRKHMGTTYVIVAEPA